MRCVVLLTVTVSAAATGLSCGLPSILAAPKRDLLFEAARTGDAEQVKALLDQGLDADTSGSLGARAILVAAQAGQCEILAILLERGARTDDAIAELALRQAITGGHACAVTRLLEGGVPVNANYYMGGTPLMKAVAAGRPGIVQLLLEHGADPNAVGWYAKPPKKPTAYWLDHAVHEGECEGTALLLACRGGPGEIVTLLLAAGADPQRADTSGCTPLLAAERSQAAGATAALRAWAVRDQE